MSRSLICQEKYGAGRQQGSMNEVPVVSLVLEQLSDDAAIVELCSRYWQLDSDGGFVYKVSELPVPPGYTYRGVAGYVAEHCHAYDVENLCPECGKGRLLTSRTDYQQRKSWRFAAQCDSCRHAQKERDAAAAEAALEAKRHAIEQRFGSIEHAPLNPHEDLTLREAVALLALFRKCASEDLTVLQPLRQVCSTFGPTEELAVDLVRCLFHTRCIHVHPQSPPSAFADDLESLDLFDVAWLPPVHHSGDPRGIVTDLTAIFRSGEWPIEWYDEETPLWREIALHECLQYLGMCMHEHGLDLSPGDKTKQVLATLLHSYSVGQMFVFIWRAAKDAAAYSVRDRVSKSHAANTVVGSIQRSAERALAEGWEIKPYRRDRRLPEVHV